MVNKLFKFILQSEEAKFFFVCLLLACEQFITNGFHIIPWIAVFLSVLASLTNLAFFSGKLSYDHKQQVIDNSLFLSAFAWGIYMWQDLSELPIAYALVYSVISVSALLLFDSLKRRLAILIPMVITFVILLVFVMSPSAPILAITTLVFLILWLIYNIAPKVIENKEQNDEGISSSEKMELVGEIDVYKTRNQELKDDLKQVELKLSAAEMAKMEFLATMSHEIRTPLNGIIPLLDILLDSDLSDFQKDYLSTAHVSAIQMQKLIDDLLDYSRVEAGKLTVETRGLKILRIMAAVNSSYQQAAQKKNIAIEVNIASNVSPLLRGDPTRLRQVLSNLLSNAIKFSTRGTIQLNAKKIKDSPSKEVVRFEVIDQGMGLDKETCDNIFLAFTQEDASSTRKFGGTGLGLAISKKIVELMNGSIGVKSEKNKGSNFYFDLPLLKSVGETSVGAAESSGYQAILVNTNPLLFNKIAMKLKEEEISYQKALGLSQAFDIYASIKKVSNNTKNVLMFLDFETAGKQVRALCNDIANDESLANLFACILTENNNIAGVPQLPNIKFISKNDSIPAFLNTIEVMQASLQANEDDTHVFKDETKDPDTTESEPSKEAAATHSNPHNTTLLPDILLVEDNEVNLKVAEKLIQYIGYPFDFALNGQEAFEKVKQNRYRMILMDCQMPVMDGYKCTARIRDFETAAGLNRTPILAMTANAMMGDREKCLDAGMDDYMSKPLNRYILEKTLKKWDPLVQPNALDNAVQQKEKNLNNQNIESNTTSEPETDSSKNIENVEEIQEAPLKIETKKTISQPAVEINQKWLSTKALEDIKEFMGDEIIQLLEMFEQETPAILYKMKTALRNSSIGEVEKMAHMLKSTSANIGANGLSFFSRKMEISAGKNQNSELLALYPKVKKAYLLTSKEIAKYVSTQ
jgi:signal transduction histidine kinase/CheY-like chemotaxis protein/HPt (histidine-containing phosphotransfer) domain-containing protein